MTDKLRSQLPEAVRMRAEAAGDDGVQWMDGLDDCVAGLEANWHMRIGSVLSGGSEAFVAEAELADGRAAIVKVRLPEAEDITREPEVLKLAAGSGYAELFEHDPEHQALLLERLGPVLDSAGLPVESQIRIICRTLDDAWIPMTSANGLTTGAEKARWLREFINDRWERLDRPCKTTTLDEALAFTHEREAAFSPDSSVLVHGDAHAHNALLAHGDSPGTDGRYKFIDPDGLFAEKACDLAVPMREWNDELLDGDTGRLTAARCALLADLTGADYHAIWQWGFIERVSTGLVLIDIAMKEEGLTYLAVADRTTGL